VRVSGIELRGPRVVLRDFALDDAPAVLEYHRDPDVMRFLPPEVSKRQTLDAIVDLLDRTMRESSLVPRVSYNLAVTVEAAVVGAARLHQPAIDAAEGEIGYLLRREVWGASYATETARLLLAYGFDVLGLEQVWATVDCRNVSSRRVLEKCGMRAAGGLNRRRQLAEGRGPSLVYMVSTSTR
jgi:[ribosomal protein S5]-alanine N-acetyltransferase